MVLGSPADKPDEGKRVKSCGRITSAMTIKMFPSQTNQLIARYSRQFMLPDTFREDALQYVKGFLKKGGYGDQPKMTEVKVENVAADFYSVWEGSRGPPKPLTEQMPKRRCAPSGPAPSTKVRATEPGAPPDHEITYEFLPLERTLRLTSADASMENSETHQLEVFTERNMTRPKRLSRQTSRGLSVTAWLCRGSGCV